MRKKVHNPALLMKVICFLLFIVSVSLCAAGEKITLVCDKISAEKIEKIVLIREQSVATAKEGWFEEGKEGKVRLVLKGYIQYAENDVSSMADELTLSLNGEVVVLTVGRSRKLQLSGWEWVKDKGVRVRTAKYVDSPESQRLPFEMESVSLSAFLASAGE